MYEPVGYSVNTKLFLHSHPVLYEMCVRQKLIARTNKGENVHTWDRRSIPTTVHDLDSLVDSLVDSPVDSPVDSLVDSLDARQGR